jgi:UDP-glucose 4-epimerase|tara:strand:+ start:24859 stop:25845 length:987 start_codon:yes stop_codon:yes gene_type:complete
MNGQEKTHKKRILITGATGYLGAHLVIKLKRDNIVYGLCRKRPKDKSILGIPKRNIIVGDLSQTKTYTELSNYNFNIIIHLVSLDHKKSETTPKKVIDVNVLPTLQLLDYFSNNGLEKFINFTALQVLGQLNPIKITDTYEPNPQNKYGLTHLLSEKVVNYYNHTTDVNCINVRLASGYGSPVFVDNNCWWLVVMDFCRTAINNKIIKLLSDGSPQRDFIHITDICNAVGILVSSNPDNLKYDNYNLGYGKTYTILELAHKVSQIYRKRYNKECPVILGNGNISSNPSSISKDPKFEYDIHRLFDIGFKPAVELNQGINEIFNYLDNL